MGIVIAIPTIGAGGEEVAGGTNLGGLLDLIGLVGEVAGVAGAAVAGIPNFPLS